MVWLSVDSPYALRMIASDADDDGTLARRIADCAPGRDTMAEAALCRRLGPRIRLYGLKHLRSEAAAADLMQDVLVMTLEKLRAGAIREPERIASFVLGAARQTSVDWRRNGRRRDRILGEFALDLVPADDREEGLDSLDAGHLSACLAALPERERTVLVMTFYDDRPAAAVASILKLSEGNVRVIRHRGLERLRSCMTAKGGRA